MPTLYPRPTPPGMFAHAGAMEEYARDRELYDLQEKIRIQQGLNPLRDVNLGQVSSLVDMPMREIAAPDQYRYRPVTEPSQVPRYRYVPTMTDEPVIQGQWEMRQALERGQPAGPLPVPEERQPQIRQRYNEPIGSLTEAPRPSVSYTQREPDPEAKANLFQQVLGEAGVRKAAIYPRWNPNAPAGGVGAANLQMKRDMIYQGLVASGVEPEEAMSKANIMAARGQTEDQYTANLAQKEAMTKQAEINTELAPKRFAEQQKQNREMNDIRRQTMRMTEMWREEMKHAIANKDYLALERLNEARHQFDERMGLFGALDKGGIFEPEEREAARRGTSPGTGLIPRDPTEDELTLFEQWFGPSKRYSYKQRPPLAPPESPLGPASTSRSSGGSTSFRGQASNAPQGQYQDAPPGKQVGDILKENGKPVAKWDGKAWQSTK